jgi:hypothetical protein
MALPAFVWVEVILPPRLSMLTADLLHMGAVAESGEDDGFRTRHTAGGRTAITSISTSRSFLTRRETSTAVLAGRVEPKYSRRTRLTASRSQRDRTSGCNAGGAKGALDDRRRPS